MDRTQDCGSCNVGSIPTGGTVFMNRPNKKISVCVVTEKSLRYTETFILRHAETFETRVYVLDQYLPRKKWFFPLLDYLKKKRFKEHLRKNSIDVVLAEFGPAGTYVMNVCKKLNVRLAVYFHGYDVTRKDVVQKYKKQYIKMFKMIKQIIVVSEDMRNDLIRLYKAPKDKIAVVPCSVDLTKTKYANQNLNEDIFLAVGRFIEKKSPSSTLIAFCRVFQKFPHARLIMIGQGKLLDECKKIVSDLHLEGAVEFKGICSHEEVLSLMSKARCFVQHSVTAKDGDKEGTPVGILEASASGLPVVSTSHAGIKQAVIHEKTGYLVEEGDIISMAEYMMKFVNNPDLASKFGKNGFDYVKSKYSTSVINKQLKQIIEDLAF